LAATIERLVRGRLVPLLETLSERGADDAVVDLQDMLLRFVFDNICVAFRVEAGCLADGLPDVPFACAFERATELSLTCFYTPPFIWKPKRLLSVGTERALVEVARAVRELAERTVADRRTELRKVGDLAGRCDLLSRLMLSTPHPAAAVGPMAERVVA
jgi:fatty acid omega-hydroxylase